MESTILRLLVSFYIASVLTYFIFSIQISVNLFSSVWKEAEFANAPIFIGAIAAIVTAILLTLRFGLIPVANILNVLEVMQDKDGYIKGFIEDWKNRKD